MAEKVVDVDKYYFKMFQSHSAWLTMVIITECTETDQKKGALGLPITDFVILRKPPEPQFSYLRNEHNDVSLTKLWGIQWNDIS